MIEGVVAASSNGVQVETTASFGQNAEWWNANRPTALIVHLPSDQQLQGYFFSKIKSDLPKDLPVLFVCEAVSSSLMQASTFLQKVRILKMPLEPQTLWKGILELLADFNTSKVVAHRYMTDQEAIVSSDFREGKMKARLKNLSVTGAYFEVENNLMSLKKEETVRLQVVISNIREYVFDCKIVWVKPLDAGTGFGVTFLDKDDVLNNLFKG